MTPIYVPLGSDAHARLHAVAAAQQKSPEMVASQRLSAALRDLPVDGRYVVVHGADLELLESILQGGSVLNGHDLAQKVDRVTGIKIGGIRLEFTPGQVEEIVARAARLGLTPEELTRRVVGKMEELFFTHLGHGV